MIRKRLAVRGQIGETTLAEGKTAAAVMIENAIEQAVNGDFKYFAEILNRIDGKVPDKVHLAGANGGALFSHTQQRAMLANPKAIELACQLDECLIESVGDHPGGVCEPGVEPAMEVPTPPQGAQSQTP